MAAPNESPPKEYSIPSGYTTYTTPDGQKFLLPTYLLTPSVAQSHSEPNAAERPERTSTDNPSVEIGGGVLIPASPPISEREARELHGEIEAIQSQYGISFKDAAHRLFMSELASVASNHDALSAFGATNKRLRDSVVNHMANPIVAIDSTPAERLNPRPGSKLTIHATPPNP
ncbi:hypothetical protein BDN70DRAFT_939319 [Pholiota conissans]|uniref:Uncharacterized protein n=1 Tax=Pholiota conissans TaxID=109636 RepID=A0A9P6CLB2_9AGAR|nr:hypothetical protein BDN70DRAFT_939319 [Pholiota conissans]